jgi:hypothetical protein
MGQSPPKWGVRDMSVYPPIATVERTLQRFRKVPKAVLTIIGCVGAHKEVDDQSPSKPFDFITVCAWGDVRKPTKALPPSRSLPAATKPPA